MPSTKQTRTGWYAALHSMDDDRDKGVVAPIAPPPDTLRPDSWMHSLYHDNRDVSLARILIPGSHDSGSHCIDHASKRANAFRSRFYRLGKPLMVSWGKTQEHDIRQQLRGGIRYLDLRVERHDGEFVLVHGLIGDTLATALADVRAFLAENPYEIIILDVYNGHAADHNAALAATVKASLGGLIISTEHGPTSALHDLWASGPSRVYVAMSDAAVTENEPLFWYRDDLRVSQWANTTDIHRLKRFVKHRITHRDADRFHVAQLVLTPGVRTIVSGALCLGRRPASNASLNRCLESRASRWIVEWYHAGLPTNIVMVDQYDRTDVVDTIIKLNAGAHRSQAR